MEHMDEKQSLKIITEMIQKAKSNFGNNSFFFLLWGWSVFAASLVHYVLLTNNNEYHYLPWPVIMVVAAVASSVYGYRQGKKGGAKSYLEKFFSVMWIAITVAIFLSLLVISTIAGFTASYVAVMLFYGLGTLITGVLIRFTPLIVGGIIVWLSSISLIWLTFPNILLVMAFAILAGYIIPGYLLRSKRERNQKLAVE